MDLLEIEALVQRSLTCGDEVVNLSHRHMTILPSNIEKLVHVKKLMLNDNKLLMPPCEIVNLSHLQCQTQGGVQGIPGIYRRRTFKILKHCSKRWLSLAKCVRRLLHHWLSLPSYFLSHDDCEKPGRVQKCASYLQDPEMYLYYLFLDFILTPLKGFNTTFQELVLDNNQLTILPSDLWKLKKLTYLSICHNPLNILSLEVCRLTSLVHLWLVKCQFVHLPPQIRQLVQLKTLSLRNNSIAELPPEMGSLHALTWLCLAENRLDYLPQELCNLKSLTYLDMNRNKFTFVPSCVAELTQLTSLHLQGNSIASVSDDVLLALSKLNKFDLRDNSITEKPEHWKGLDYILIGKTGLDSLDREDSLCNGVEERLQVRGSGGTNLTEEEDDEDDDSNDGAIEDSINSEEEEDDDNGDKGHSNDGAIDDNMRNEAVGDIVYGGTKNGGENDKDSVDCNLDVG